MRQSHLAVSLSTCRIHAINTATTGLIEHDLSLTDRTTELPAIHTL